MQQLLNSSTGSKGRRSAIVTALLVVIGYQEYRLRQQNAEIAWLWTELKPTISNSQRAAGQLGLRVDKPKYEPNDQPATTGG